MGLLPEAVLACLHTMSVTTDTADSQVGQDLPQDEPALTTDKIFHILQNDRRRNVLRYLRGTDEPVRMRDLAEQVAAWEHDTTVQGLSSSQRQRVYIPLYQSHLPKLDKEGVINYQQSRGIVERTSLADLFDPYLEAEETDEPPVPTSQEPDEWHDYYLVVSTLGTLLLVGAILELPVFGTLSGIAIALALLFMISFVTVGRHLSG